MTLHLRKTALGLFLPKPYAKEAGLLDFWPFCMKCGHAVEAVEEKAHGRRNGYNYADIEMRCHGKAEVVCIKWVGRGMEDEEIHRQLAKEVSKLVAFDDGRHIGAETT